METEGGKLSIDDSSRDLMRTLFENQNRALDFKEQRGDDREETDFHSLHGGVDLDPNEEATFLNSNEDKAKTSLRMNYEAQAKVIERQTGGLEAIRLQLGLSQRKMAQLLLVDPSAWTRWMKTSPPPHILRSLQWYMALQEKIPGLTPQYFIGKDPEILHRHAMDKIDEEKKKREALVENVFTQTIKMEEEIRELQRLNEELLAQQKKLLLYKDKLIHWAKVLMGIGVFIGGAIFLFLKSR